MKFLFVFAHLRAAAANGYLDKLKHEAKYSLLIRWHLLILYKYLIKDKKVFSYKKKNTFHLHF